MADNTGAPHFIPYVEPTDLVREYPAADEASAFAIAAALDAAVVAGIGSNVVQTVKTTTFTTTAAVADIPDFAVTITPSSATAKVLIIATFTVGNLTGEAYRFFINRGATQIAVGGASATEPTADYFTGAPAAQSVGSGILVLDSPASTSATTYQVRLGRTAGTAVFNRRGDVNAAQFASLVAIEVAA